MIRRVLTMVAATAVIGVGCGDDGSSDGGSAGATRTAMTPKSESTATKATPKGTLIKTVSSEYGRVVADGKGEAFYLFDREDTAKSECYGDCAVAWPPVLTKGKPRAGEGVEQRLLGTTERRNGKRQVTYDGHPLYYYKDDSPGTILCHDVDEFGGLWLVVSPNGQPVA